MYNLGSEVFIVSANLRYMKSRIWFYSKLIFLPRTERLQLGAFTFVNICRRQGFKAIKFSILILLLEKNQYWYWVRIIPIITKTIFVALTQQRVLLTIKSTTYKNSYFEFQSYLLIQLLHIPLMTYKFILCHYCIIAPN